jgi:leucyl aminopeptidase
MRLNFASVDLKTKGALAVLVAADQTLFESGESLDKSTGGALRRAMNNNDFSGVSGEKLVLNVPYGVLASQIVLIGIGKRQDFDALAAQAIGGRLYAYCSAQKALHVMVDKIRGCELNPAEIGANIAFGALLRSYRFDKYRTNESAAKKPRLKVFTVCTAAPREAQRIFDPLSKLGKGVFFTRDLVSEPANVIFPKSFVSRARELGKLGCKLQVLNQAEMKKMGMGALLGVAQGSANAPQLLSIRWDGAPKAKDKSPIAFVGKGVTFDTGGISIKPAGGMEDMKWDMGGAGVVIGLMRVLAERKAKVNAVGVVGLVENMPSGTAQRPGDVVKTMSGQTIEVINTDAEGRLVLADAMWWCQEKFKPHTMVDLATLTGAIIISLGHHYAGLFSNDDELAGRLFEAGKLTGEKVWRMPLAPEYDKQVKSMIADMKNVGGRDGGSITAAQILQRFVKDDVKWAHLDIAGVTWSNSDKPTQPRGGTGFGVRLLDSLVANYYEEKPPKRP